MTDIEFIDKEITSYKHLAAFSSNDAKKYYEECVVLLQQIKAELEAWEAVKELLIKSKSISLSALFKYHREVYNKINKALEVKDV